MVLRNDLRQGGVGMAVRMRLAARNRSMKRLRSLRAREYCDDRQRGGYSAQHEHRGQPVAHELRARSTVPLAVRDEVAARAVGAVVGPIEREVPSNGDAGDGDHDAKATSA